MPGFTAMMKTYEIAVDWAQLTTLQGRTDSGEWRTSFGKEYPSRMNEALAASFAATLERAHQATPDRSVEPTDLAARFQELYAGDIPFEDQHMRPDFCGRERVETDTE